MVDLDEFRATLAVPQHCELFEYWRSKAPAGGLPPRGAIDAVDIPRLLPWIVVFDVIWEDGRPEFRFRVIGTGCVERYGRDATGRRFEEVYEGETLARQQSTYEQAARTGAPDRARPEFPVSEKEHVVYDRLILPLADDGVTVDALIALMIFE